jgi:anaerobic selenocysteine-containing dehydrogenase
MKAPPFFRPGLGFRTSAADIADLRLRPRPGTDMAVAMTMIKVCIDRLFANMSRSDMTILTRLLGQIIVEGGRLVEADAAGNK